jgi:hypothetical protein
MAQTKILLDSNSYFRLAKEIHPLLFKEFGEECYCLYVLGDLQEEYDRNRRLQTKFPWVDDPDYRANRSRPLNVSRKQKSAIITAEEFMWETVQAELPGPSRIDVRNLAHAYTLIVPLVTDDIDLKELASLYDVSVMSTLRLLRLMLDCGHIKMDDIRRIAGFWSWLGDRPGGFSREYRKLFKEKPPP